MIRLFLHPPNRSPREHGFQLQSEWVIPTNSNLSRFDQIILGHNSLTLSHWSGEFSPFYGRSAKCFPVSFLYNHGFKSGLAFPTQFRGYKSAEDLKMKAHRTSLLMENQWSEPTFRDPPHGSRYRLWFPPLVAGMKRSVVVSVGQVSCGLASRRKRGR